MLLHEQFVVPVVYFVVNVALSEFSEEKPTPNSHLFHRRRVLQLVNVAFSVIDVKRVEVVGCQLWRLEPRF